MKRESFGRLTLGLATGTLFGFLLHKSRAAEYEKISGQLLFEDASVLKIMGSAAAVGAVGTELLAAAGRAEKKIKPLDLGGIVLGGTLFGTGMALLGYCPGTTMAALGKGRKDAAAGLLGMAAGALAFIRLYPQLKPVLEKGALGKITLPEVTHTPPWLWIGGLGAIGGAVHRFLESREGALQPPHAQEEEELWHFQSKRPSTSTSR